MASWTQGSIVKWIMSPSKLLSKNKTQNSKISTHEWVGSYTHSSRKIHLPHAQANIQLQKTIQNSSTTQWAHHSKNKNFPLHLRNLKPVFTPSTHTHLTPNCIKIYIYIYIYKHHYYQLELTHTMGISFQNHSKASHLPWN